MNVNRYYRYFIAELIHTFRQGKDGFIKGGTTQSTPGGFAQHLLTNFRHITQKFLEIRQYSCVISVQSDEKSVGTSTAQSLRGVALQL